MRAWAFVPAGIFARMRHGKLDFYLRLFTAALGLLLLLVALAGAFVVKDLESAAVVGVGAAFNFFAAYAAHRRLRQRAAEAQGRAEKN